MLNFLEKKKEKKGNFPALMPVYRRSDIVIDHGKGVYLYDASGKEYLDFASGIAVNSLGHCHPHVVKALKDQADKVWHCSNLYRLPEQERLAQRLVDRSFADSVFFCNTGLEAVECGLKMVRKFYDENGQPERYRVITVQGSFHGRSLATISAADNPKNMKGFEPAMEGFDHVPFNDLEAVRAKIGPYTAAILIEPIQGEGGIRVAPNEYLRGLRELADEFGLLLFFDEVQCGVGRPGSFFYYEQTGVMPDIMSVAKGIGTGFPLAACMATAKVAASMSPGSHGSTYGGNPLGMAVGNAVLDVMFEDGFIDHVNRMGKLMRTRLQAVVEKYPEQLEEVRGIGLILGLKTRCDNTELAAKLRDHGLLTVPAAENVIRILPPLIIEESHVTEAMEKLEDACRDIANHA